MSFRLYFIVFLPSIYGFVRNGTTGEAWGYIDVRDNAHMFWMLDGEAPTVQTNHSRPFMMWLQGGPGASSTGFGNFAEIGPLDEGLRPRSSTWSTVADILFVDNPVGTGFSYVTPPATYTTTESQIDDDLYSFMKQFLEELPEYQKKPFYIFGVSYGGKMGATFGLRLLGGIRSGDIRCNFKGVVLGDSWISPVDSVENWAPFLKQSNLLDDAGFESLSRMSQETISAVESGQFTLATELWKQTQAVMEQNTDEVNPYHVLQHHAPSCFRQFGLMNGVIRQKLGIIPDSVIWDAHRTDVFASQSVNFMKPAIADVGQLIASGIKVVVFQGQFDLLCDTPGTESWISKLPWSELPQFQASALLPLCVNGVPQGNVKRFKNFAYYFITNAGHMVPVDNPEAGLEMLRQIVSDA